ncbi:hypothetical protein DYB32_001067 [Aphanomyces invadans]|uniref:Uncharacterized protein n=1 Tax=Aphanomyces invadans TaxID=157072 RepID=A0A3R6W3D7_9STRA|nr:hypothetical protein DYB32_001067 [Aphanomyces invadans]
MRISMRCFGSLDLQDVDGTSLVLASTSDYTACRDAGLLLTDDKHIQFMNKKYRNKDKPTDILSFPNYTVRSNGSLNLLNAISPYTSQIQTPGVLPDARTQEGRYLGDMFLSLPYIEAYCRKNGRALLRSHFKDCRFPCTDTTLEERMPILVAHGLCHLMGSEIWSFGIV